MIVEYYSAIDNKKYEMYHEMMQDFLKKKEVIGVVVNKHLFEKDPNAVRGIMGEEPDYLMYTPSPRKPHFKRPRTAAASTMAAIGGAGDHAKTTEVKKQ